MTPVCFFWLQPTTNMSSSTFVINIGRKHRILEPFLAIIWSDFIYTGYEAIRLLNFYFPLCIPPPYMPCSTPASLYFDFPKLIGMYLCLYICKICRFIVIKNRTKKYISRIGQNTGTSKTEKKVITMDVPTPFVHANQNLNSGRRRANGLNSFPSDAVVGRPGCSEGSSKGERKAIKLFKRKIPKP